MKRIPTFIDGSWHGFYTVRELNDLRKDAYKVASQKQEEEQADHMLYCHYDYDPEDNHTIKTAHLYFGYPMTDEEFDRVEKMKHVYIGAIHRHK